MEFKLPELGEGVHEGELVKWKVKPGDDVGYDQPLCEIMTDKATVEIPSAFKGKVATIHVKEGQVVHVGQLMCSFEGAEATKAATPAPASAPAPAAAAAAVAPAVSAAPKPAPVSMPAPEATFAGASAAGAQVPVSHVSAGEVTAAPSTRRLARELGVQIDHVHGSGPAGRVTRDDLEDFVRSGRARMTTFSMPSATPTRAGGSKAEERVAFKGLRKKISEKMRLSKDHAAHFTYVEEADATELVALRAAAKEIGAKQGIKVTYLPFIMKAMVAALKQFPILNSSLDEEKNEIVYKHYFNIGLSVQTEDGLTAPVVKNVEDKSVWQIAREIDDLVIRARAKKLTMDDLTGGSITLTNAGSIGGLFATPVINYPEVAILGFNKIFRKPVARMVGGQEKIEVRDWTYFSISLDHRVVDGAVGAEFMKTFIRYIETPSLLVLEA